MTKRTRILLPLAACALLAAGLATTAGAQVEQRWAVTEADVVVSWAWPDIDGDGVQELIMEDGVASWFYDGTNSYEQVWYVEDPNSASTTIFGLWLQEAGWCVFRQQDATNQQARLHVYRSGAASESWNSGPLGGNITEGGIGDFDGDGQLELAWSWHNWDGSAWTSQWTVRDLGSGAVELAPQSGAGYLSGPWTANVEGDESEELLLNWYWTDGTSQLVCWGAASTVLEPAPVKPGTAALAAWPNPFNPACRIRLDAAAGVETVTIHNVAGQELRRLPLSAPGRVDVVWDGLDQRGRPAASGVYLVRAGAQSRTITLAR